ncbi:MAG: enoyl-CoA hydratase [Gammaproteobacteria bacterium RIFCSPHIGHO2_12_FULL_45_12]|nr:MAG: enoyl-CoA hydratase [Gammaproteobacteria bacterium RIFCSPHIGHO2_12_FULL_45_12]
MDYLENQTYDELNVGESAELSRTLTEKDIQVFAIMSGDINPAHVDVEYAQSDMFHKIIGHGMWGAALISTVLGTQLPGPGTVYVSQTLRFKKPVGIGDTVTVKVTVTEMKPEKKRVLFDCQCVNQENVLVMEGQAEVIAPSKKIRRLKAELPEISLRRTKSLFNGCLVKAKKLGALRAGVIHPIRSKIMVAVHDACQAGLIEPVLIGQKALILAAAKEAGIDVSGYELVDVEHSHAAIIKAIMMARAGEVGMLVRGGAKTEDLVHAMQKVDKGLLTDQAMSYVSVLDVPTYSKLLILTDTLINMNPNLDVKRGITQNAIDFAQALGVARPKVAILAGADTVNYNTRSTVDAAALCKMAERGQIRGGILDGPLTFDNIISSETAKSKGIESPVIGDADILVVPSVETGNILAEQLEYLAESHNAGLLLGARVPVLMSHINDIFSSTASCALAVLNKHKRSHDE